MKRVRKGIIPAAGLGTRFLPATKAIPKEMLPIVDKPTIQYVVEEAVESGFENIAFVTSRGKNAIEDHFDYDFELEAALKHQGKKELWQIVHDLSRMIAISSIRQKEPLGLGHAILVTESFVGEEPLGVFLGDDIIRSETPCMKQLLQIHEQTAATVLAVQEVPSETVSRYGILSGEPAEGENSDRLFKVRDLVEKPTREKAPSNLAIIGRYILTPGIFPALRETKPGTGGEIQLTDGLNKLLESEPVYAYRFEGERYDAGNKLEFLMAVVDFALERPDLGEQFRHYLSSLHL